MTSAAYSEISQSNRFGNRSLKSRLSAALLGLALCLALTSVVPVEAVHAADATIAQKVDINHADAESIAATLTGVGLKRAQAIVAYREKMGNFASLEQLIEVKGIGPSVLAKNKERIVLK